MVGFWRTQTLRAAVELRLVEALPSTPDRLAQRLALVPDRCERLLRALGELGLVVRESDTWHATRRGALLHPQHPLQMADAALHWGRDCYRLWEALPNALRAHDPWTPPRFFEALSSDAQRVASYHRAMSSYARQDYAHLSDALAHLSSGTVIDAGGGTGTLLAHLLEQRPGLQGVLLERPEVLQQVTVPAALAARMTLVPGDLFSPWDVQAHAVILARVLHDWEDAEATRILERARAALRASGRIHVIEFLLDEERLDGSLLDLHMLVTTGGRERTERRFRELLSRAGLRLLSRQRLGGGNVLLTAEPS
jgi:predicted transcriptional regulator